MAVAPLALPETTTADGGKSLPVPYILAWSTGSVVPSRDFQPVRRAFAGAIWSLSCSRRKTDVCGKVAIWSRARLSCSLAFAWG